jgi:hypothetical protein
LLNASILNGESAHAIDRAVFRIRIAIPLINDDNSIEFSLKHLGKILFYRTLNSVRPEMVDGPPNAAKPSGQGLSVFTTAGMVVSFRGLQKST